MSSTPRTDDGKQHWAEAVVECVSDNSERERLIRLYDYDELVQACLALGSLALTAKNEYARAEKLELELAESQKERMEQARLLGMSAEKELKLQTDLSRTREALKETLLLAELASTQANRYFEQVTKHDSASHLKTMERIAAIRKEQKL